MTETETSLKLINIFLIFYYYLINMTILFLFEHSEISYVLLLL